MARKKRASLKDKGPEILGLTQSKGKGIDVLFGGPADESSIESLVGTPEAKIEVETVEVLDTETDIPPEAEEPQPEVIETIAVEEPVVTAAPPPPPPISANLPGVEYDELGLPVAMEGPPPDMEFSSSPEELVGMPYTSPNPYTDFEADDDLSELLAEEDSLTDEAPEPPDVEEDVVPVLEDTFVSPPIPPVSVPIDTSPPATEIPIPFEPAPPPPVAEMTGLDQIPAPVDETSIAPPPPPSALTPARPIIESLGGIITERIETSPEDLLPPDLAQQQEINNILDLKERTQLEKDEAISARVSRYVGRERRENLDAEIERLYTLVATELSANKEDAEFALRTLSEAQDIILEDTRQYDEALYRVAVVKTMLARKQNLRNWSYTYGMGIFVYAVAWLGLFIFGFLSTDFLNTVMGESGEGLAAVRGAWFSALSGGIGGIIGIFYSLYWHVAMKQDFDRQYVMYYLVQPIMGFILGALIYFIVLAGYLVFNLSTPTESPDTITAIAIVLGFIAGFRQRIVFEMIDRIVQKLMPRSQDEPSQDPISLAPVDFQEKN
jgi:hypothetical protein